MKAKQILFQGANAGKMTSAERLEIAKVIRLRSKVAKQDCDVRAAQGWPPQGSR